MNNLDRFRPARRAARRPLWAAGLLILLPLASRAQLTLSTVSPARNAIAAPAGAPAVLTFSQALKTSTAANVRLFSSQHGGQLARGTAAAASGSTLTVQPAARLLPGETVVLSVPATVASSTGTAATPQVFQYTAAVAGGVATFGTELDSSVGTNPNNLVTADVDGDGDLDILTANYSNTVSVRLNDGKGNFTGGSEVPTAGRCEALTMADIDNDGDLDCLASYDGSNGNTVVAVLLNNGKGNFAGSVNTDVPVLQYVNTAITAGDLDGDGDLDILVAGGGDGKIVLLLNDGTGLFTVGATVAGGFYTADLAAVDIDGDGDLDILAANNGGHSVSVRLNDGKGKFSSAPDVAVGGAAVKLTLGDVDGDGDLDILTANSTSNSVSVRLNDGLGNFSGTTDLSLGLGTNAVSLGDLDGDGDLDLVAFNTANGSEMSVRLNNGKGTFTGANDVHNSNYFTAGTVADVTGDGALDLVAFAYGSGAVAVRPNQSLLPTLTGIAPAFGPVGSTITLTGSNFAVGSVVLFNGTVASSVTRSSAGSLAVVVPAGATSGNVTVTTSGGITAGLPFTVGTALAAAPAALVQQVSLYPSPARATAFVELPAGLAAAPAVAELLDNLGRVVLRQPLPAGPAAHALPLAGLAPGVYSLRLATAAGPLVKKLLID